MAAGGTAMEVEDWVEVGLREIVKEADGVVVGTVFVEAVCEAPLVVVVVVVVADAPLTEQTLMRMGRRLNQHRRGRGTNSIEGLPDILLQSRLSILWL